MEMVKLCMGLNPQYGPPLEEQISLLKKAGFHGFFVKWERGMDLAPLQEKAQQEGMLFQSIHAPFFRVCDLWEETDQTPNVLNELIECLHLCHRYQVPVMVSHAYIGFDKPYCPTASGLRNFEKIVEAAQRLQVKIAFENTEGEEYLAALMQHFSASPWVGFCWDTGHEMCYNRGRDLMALYGHRLMATHINDNLGVCDPGGRIDLMDDLHLLPFDGKVDWQEIAGKLRCCGFKGPLTFELLKHSKPGRHENDQYEKMTAEEYFAAAHERAIRLAHMVQQPEERALIWAVGDSTVSAFWDPYYIPRQGWGEQLERYFDAEVYNLARSGASSRDFTGMPQYDALLNGSDTVPPLGEGEGEKFLLIGFGHNDQKREDTRFTDPNGDYRRAGSFACSLYENYVKPARNRGVTPVLVTPIARLTDENTMESYQSASGHVTEEAWIGDAFYPGGDYAAAIRDLGAALKLPVLDLTDETIRLNVEMGGDARYLHAFEGAAWAENGEILIPDGLDKTHTNVYGARMHAWLIARLSWDTALGKYAREGMPKPSYDRDFADSINPDYEAPPAPCRIPPIIL